MLKPKKHLAARKEIKQDKFVTFYFTAREYVVKYRKQLSYGLVALVAVAAMVAFKQSSDASSEREAALELARGGSAYDSGNYDEAIQLLGPVSTKYSGTRGGAMGTLLLAKSFVARENYDEAERYFRLYLSDYGDDVILRLAAHTGLAACLDQKGDHAGAAAAYEDAAEADEIGFKAPELLLDAARCYRLAGQPDAARAALNKLIEEYPDSQSVTDARIYLAELKA